MLLAENGPALVDDCVTSGGGWDGGGVEMEVSEAALRRVAEMALADLRAYDDDEADESTPPPTC